MSTRRIKKGRRGCIAPLLPFLHPSLPPPAPNHSPPPPSPSPLPHSADPHPSSAPRKTTTSFFRRKSKPKHPVPMPPLPSGLGVSSGAGPNPNPNAAQLPPQLPPIAARFATTLRYTPIPHSIPDRGRTPKFKSDVALRTGFWFRCVIEFERGCERKHRTRTGRLIITWT